MYHPRLKGLHYDMGKHYGEIMFNTGVNMTDTIKLTNIQIDFGKESLPLYEKYAPKIMDEVRGLADGLQVSYEQFAYWLIALYCFESDHGCSVFAVNSNGITYFGRNMDMFPEFKKTSESVLYMPQNIKPGLNGGFLIRMILEECKTTEEAITMLKSVPISSCHNIIIADKSGDLAVAEITSEKICVRKSDSYVIATNHFIEQGMGKYNCDEGNWYLTRDRYATMEMALSKQSVDFYNVKSILSGETGFICQYDKKLHFDTIWSAAYNLETLYNEIAEGNPAKTKFKNDNRLEWGMNKKIYNKERK